MKRLILSLCVILCAVFAAACGKPKPSPDAVLRHAIESAKTGDWKNALARTEQVIAERPQDVRALALYAMALENNDRMEEALSAAQHIPLNCNSFFALYTLGRIQFLNGKYEQCITPLAEAEKLRPNDANTLLLLARASLHLRTKAAIAYYGKLKSSPEFASSPVPANEIGVAKVCIQSFHPAILEFSSALRKAPNSPEVNLNLGILYDYHLRNPKLARPYYQKYLQLTVDHPELEKERGLVAARINSTPRR